MTYKLFRATIHKTTVTHVDFKAPADASPEELAQMANDAEEEALERHESDDMEPYDYHWDSITRSKVARVDLVEDIEADDGMDGA